MSTKSKRITGGPEGRQRRKLNTSQLSVRQVEAQEFLNNNIVAQPGLVNAATRAYGRGISVIRRAGRPIYVVFALGKKGTGKSFTPSVLAEYLHGDPEALTMIRCGAYKEPHRVAQLIGAPPSYTGYKDPQDPKNQLPADKTDPSAKLTRHNLVASRKGSEVPISIVVVDEVEKAIEELEDVLLSIMWEGKLDLGNNDTTEFGDVILWLTGNVAAHELEQLGKRIGFVPEVVTQEKIEDTVTEVLGRRYKPEFLDRMDEIVIARDFDDDDLRRMIDVHASRLRRRLDEVLPRGRQFELAIDESALKFVADLAAAETESARGIVRALEVHIEDPLGNELEKGEITLGDFVEVVHEEGEEGLSFYVTEGEGDVSEADTLAIFGNRDSGTGLGMQRRAHAANSKARKTAKKNRYRVEVPAKDEKQLAKLAAEVLHEAKAIFGLKVVEASTTFEAPFVAGFVFEGIEEQIELLKGEFKGVEVTKLEDEK